MYSDQIKVTKRGDIFISTIFILLDQMYETTAFRGEQEVLSYRTKSRERALTDHAEMEAKLLPPTIRGETIPRTAADGLPGEAF